MAAESPRATACQIPIAAASICRRASVWSEAEEDAFADAAGVSLLAGEQALNAIETMMRKPKKLA